MSQTKLCYNCKEVLDVSKFSKNKNRKDGLQTYCKHCMSYLLRKVYFKNKQKHNKRYYKKHKEHLKELAKIYYQNNRKEIYETSRLNYQNKKLEIADENLY